MRYWGRVLRGVEAELGAEGLPVFLLRAESGGPFWQFYRLQELHFRRHCECVWARVSVKLFVMVGLWGFETFLVEWSERGASLFMKRRAFPSLAAAHFIFHVSAPLHLTHNPAWSRLDHVSTVIPPSLFHWALLFSGEIWRPRMTISGLFLA